MAGASWSAIGPAPQLNGDVAFSGRVTAIAKSPDIDGQGTAALFISVEGGGVWRATQYTSPKPAWQSLTDIVSAAPINRTGLSDVQSLVVAPNDPRLIYAGSAAGILRSTDGGHNWVLVPSSPRSARALIVVGSASNITVWAGGDFGLAISGDGLVWNNVAIGGFGLSSFAIDDLEWTVNGDGSLLTIYAALHDATPGNDGSHHGIYVTTNLGGHWDRTAIDPVDHDTDTRVLPASFGAITLDADHTPGSVHPPAAALSKISGDWRRAPLLNVFRLNGLTWEPIGKDLPNGLDTQGGANQPIAITPAGDLYFAVSGNYSPHVFQSLDSGEHWSDITTANGVSPHVDHHALLFTDGALYDGNDGGIWRFTPRPFNQPGAGRWEHLNGPGLQTIMAQGVSIHPTDAAILLIGSQDNGTALRTQGDWRTVQWSDRGRVRFSSNGVRAYTVTYGWFDRSDDSGATWQAIDLPANEFAAGSMQLFEVDPFAADRLLIAGLRGVWLSTDAGDNWRMIAPALAGMPNAVAAMAFSNQAPTIYVAFGNGRLFRTTNGGAAGSASDWTDISSGTNWGGMIVAIGIDPVSASAVYIATSAGRVWRTTNAMTWEELTGDLPAIPLSSLVVAGRAADPTLAVGSASGVYVCWTPATPRWRRLGADFPYAKVTDLTYQASGDILGAGTYGRGIFVTKLGTGFDAPPIDIQVPVDECGLGRAEGQTVRATCYVAGISGSAMYGHEWTVNGAALAAGQTGHEPSIKVTLPSPPAQVTLTVNVTDDDGFVGSATLSFVPTSVAQAVWMERLCKLKRMVRVNFFVDPLWDPLRDYTTRPVTEAEVVRMMGIAAQIVDAARGVLAAMRPATTQSPIRGVPERIPMRGLVEDRPKD